MLIVLAVVAVISAFVLIRNSRKTTEPVVVSEGSEKKEEKKQTSGTRSSPRRSGGSGGGRSGGSGSSKSTVGSISIGDLKKHARLNDCWVTMGGDVYSLNNYIQSSGENNISQYCGTLGFESGYIGNDTLKMNKIKKQSSKVGKLG